MPYIIETAAGQYVRDVLVGRGEVKTSRVSAHVAHTLREALAMRDLARASGLRCGICGVTPWPLIGADDNLADEDRANLARLLDKRR